MRDVKLEYFKFHNLIKVIVATFYADYIIGSLRNLLLSKITLNDEHNLCHTSYQPYYYRHLLRQP